MKGWLPRARNDLHQWLCAFFMHNRHASVRCSVFVLYYLLGVCSRLPLHIKLLGRNKNLKLRAGLIAFTQDGSADLVQ